MRRPLVPALGALLASCLLAATVSADPKPKQPPKTPKQILKDQVCKDGAYVRPKPKKEAKPEAKGETKPDAKGEAAPEKGKTDETADAAPKLPSGEGGDFSPVGDTGMSKFTPKGDCSGTDDTGFDKLFEPGADGVVPADSLEIAPATKNGVPPGPEKFTSLSGLTHLLENKAQSAELMKGFFDGTTPAALQDIKARADAADAAAAAAAAEGAVVADVGPKPLPEGMTAAKPLKLDGHAVPPPGSPKDPEIVTPPAPKTRYNPTAADVPPPAPAERPFWGGLGNDIKSVYNDVKSGGGLISNEGFMPRSDTTNAGTVPAVNSNPDPSITVPLPGAPIRPREKELAPSAPGINPNGCRPGCYGTARMISLLKSIGEQYTNSAGGNLNVGGISLYTGGPFPPHVSHRKGIDADISFVNHGKGFDRVENAMIVAGVVRALKDFQHINGVEYILCDQSKHAAIGEGLDYLVKQGILTQPQAARGKSVLVHWPNHNDHFHIRMR